jgi:hypothetical protein
MVRKVIGGLSLALLCLLGLSGVGSADPGCDGGACAVAGCAGGDCCHKYCQPTVELKKFDKRVYSVACHDFCYPPLCGKKPHCDQCGSTEPCFHCGHPHTRRVLVVKIRKDEKLVNTCKLYPPEPGSEAPTESLGEREALGGQVPSATAPGGAVPFVPATPQGPQMGQRQRLGGSAAAPVPNGMPYIVPSPGPSQVPGRIVYPTAPLSAPGTTPQTLRNPPTAVPASGTPTYTNPAIVPPLPTIPR